MNARQLLQGGIADIYYYWTFVRKSQAGYWRTVRDRFPTATEGALQSATQTAREAVAAARKLSARTTDRPLATEDAPFRPSYHAGAGGATGKRWYYRVTVSYTVGGGPEQYYTTFISSPQSLGQATVRARAIAEATSQVSSGGGSPRPGQRSGQVNVTGATIDTVFRF